MLTTISRPLLLGHRGLRPVRRFGVRTSRALVPPENSIAAFDRALAAGCDGFEFDVRFTSDKRAVLWHDPQMDGREVSLADYAELHRRRSHLACVEDVLDRFAKTAYLDVELKVAGNEEVIVAALRTTPPTQGFVVSSFLPKVVFRLHELDSSLPLGYVCKRAEDVQRWSSLPIRVFIPHLRLVSKRLIDDVHSHGIQLFTWTVNRQSDMLRLAAAGVDGLISDDPALLVRTFLPQRIAAATA